MMQNSSMSDMLREMMEKKEGGKSSFSMMGQYTSSVMQEEDTGREYVMYDSPNGEQVKVYGNWNEYAVTRDEEGRDMIADEDYPIIQNKDGEFVLDEQTFEGRMGAIEEGRMAEGGPGESRVQDLMERLSQRRGQGGEPAPGMAFKKGGKFPDLNKDGKVTMADILKGRGVFQEGGKVDEDIETQDELFARPEPMDYEDPDSPMGFGFYIRGERVSSRDFMRALEERGNKREDINKYVRSGAKYAPKFDREEGKFRYRDAPMDERLQRFFEQQMARRRG